MMSVIVDPAAFDAPDAEAEADAFVEWVKASPLAADAERIYAPGEPERATRAEREANGIPVDPETWRQIRTAALAAGLSQEQADSWSAHLR
jgi:uncharacterized oxidoreductase